MFNPDSLQPTEDRLLVRPDGDPKISDGGIHLPDNTVKDSQPITGTVLKVGPGKMVLSSEGVWFLQDMMVKPGHKVLYSRWAGNQARDCGDYHIIKESDVLAIIS